MAVSYAQLFKQENGKIFKVKEIDVSEELSTVKKMYVKELNGFTKLSIIQSNQTETEKMFLMICMSLCDENGEPTETPETFGELVQNLSDSVFNKLLKATLEVNNATQKGADELKK